VLIFRASQYSFIFYQTESITSSSMVFKASALEGAILTIPRGARSQDLGNYARFREYAAANLADWYKFVNGPRGREARNGDIHLVTGFDKTTSWGIATFVDQTPQNSCHLSFGPSEDAGSMSSSSTYRWDCSGDAEVQVGPGLNQMAELGSPDDPPDVQFENQCLFVRTLNIALADDLWADIHSGLASVYANPQHSHHHHHSNNPGADSSSNFISSHGAQAGMQGTSHSLYGLQDVHLVLDDNPKMLIFGPFKSLVSLASQSHQCIVLIPFSNRQIIHLKS
jgi:hypothetical protein